MRLLLVQVIYMTTFFSLRYETKRLGKLQRLSLMKAITTQELHSILNAYHEMYSNCQDTFRLHRWNCPIPERVRNTRHPVSLTALYPLATKEVSYIYSLSAAALVHNIINSCLMGVGKNCPCQSKSKPRYNGERINCQQNFEYGFKRGKKVIRFFDYKFVTNKARKIFNWENSMVGLNLYKEKLPVLCRCHGISGHCATKYCWKTTPVNLRNVSMELRKMYESAERFELNFTQKDATLNKKRKQRKASFSRYTRTKPSLKFIDDSPNYCQSNKRLGITGTLHRECDHYNESSCLDLCSKCGYRKHSYLRNVERKCKCKFHWCCKVTCNVCLEKKVFARCERHF
nr:Wnt8 protein [Cladonema pacificum]